MLPVIKTMFNQSINQSIFKRILTSLSRYSIPSSSSLAVFACGAGSLEGARRLVGKNDFVCFAKSSRPMLESVTYKTPM